MSGHARLRLRATFRRHAEQASIGEEPVLLAVRDDEQVELLIGAVAPATEGDGVREAAIGPIDMGGRLDVEPLAFRDASLDVETTCSSPAVRRAGSRRRATSAPSVGLTMAANGMSRPRRGLPSDAAGPAAGARAGWIAP
jgi:hypothetical protein